MELELTKSAKKSLALLYTEYKKRLKSETRDLAARFARWEWPEIYDAVKTDMPELKASGLVRAEVRVVILTPIAISYMENKAVNTIKEWLSFAAQFIP